MQELLKKNQHFYWNEKHQKAFDTVKQALADATALAAPSEEGRFELDTDASAVAIAGILHQEQEHNGRTVLRPIVYGPDPNAIELWRLETRNVCRFLFY